MIKSKSFLRLFFLVTFLGIISLPLFNYLIDTSRVLTRDYLYKYDSPKYQGNMAFLKTSYLLERKGEFDSLILGSSRVNRGFSEADLSSELGGSWLKLAYPAGVPSDHLNNLKVLFSHEHKIKKIILTLDDFVIYKRPNRKKDYFYRLYPTAWTGWLDFYKFYLFKKPSDFEYEVLRGEVKLKSNRWFELSAAARQPEALSAEKLEKLYNREAVSWFMNRDKTVLDEALADIQLISDLCRENNTQLTIMIMPRFYKTMLWRDQELLSKFKRGLVGISPFYDFSIMNNVSLTTDYWIDSSHFVRIVGKLVAKSISERKGGGDFGALVSENNIEHHLESLHSKLANSIPSVFEIDKTVAIHPSILTRNQAPLKLLKKSTFSSSKDAIRVLVPKVASLKDSNYILNIALKKVDKVSSIELDVMNRHEEYPSHRRFVKTYSFLLSGKEMREGVSLLFKGINKVSAIKDITLYKLGNG